MGADLAVIGALGLALTEVLKRFVPIKLLPEVNPVFDQDRAKVLLSAIGFGCAWFILWSRGQAPTDVLALVTAWLAQNGFYAGARSLIPGAVFKKIGLPDPLNR